MKELNMQIRASYPPQPIEVQGSAASSTRWMTATMGKRLSITLVMLMGMAVSLMGLNTAPLEGHEIFVVQTAREMRSHSQWIVPYFNGELRLNKPPLNYWMTAGVSILAGDSDVKPWHGRMVSAIGGMLIVSMTIAIGCMMGSTAVGVTAGLLVSTSLGYLIYSHDGRPDMLYAGLCTVMIALWLYAWRASKNPQQKIIASLAMYGMWIMLALATLSKGPHIPLLFVIIFAGITYAKDRSWKSCFKLFRPITGLLLALLLIAPWWLALYANVGDVLFDSQLAGKRYGVSLWAIVNPYYFYRTFFIILPWCLLWVLAGQMMFQHNKRTNLARIMLALVVCLLLALSLATGKRIVYVMPLLGPLSLLMALGAQRLAVVVRQDRGWFGRRFCNIYVMVYTFISVGAIITTTILHASRLEAAGLLWVPVVGVAAVLLTAGAVLYLCKIYKTSSDRGATVAIRGAMVIFAWFFIVTAAVATTQNANRWLYQEGSLKIHAVVPQGTEVYTLDAKAMPFLYYTDRGIEDLSTPQELDAAIKLAHGQAYVITTVRMATKIKAELPEYQSIDLFVDGKDEYELLEFGKVATKPQAAAAVTP